MQEIGRYILFAGIILIVVGGLISLAGKVPFLGKLPGDIVIRRGDFTLYAPLASSILISIVLSLTFMIIGQIRR